MVYGFIVKDRAQEQPMEETLGADLGEELGLQRLWGGRALPGPPAFTDLI